ncbi:MAG: hypothetical protein C6W55_00115 [Thermobacillus sp.]|uniref:hypothetical protein n=1 Tax=Thermobacillus sp. TaxID=2108467 RepID=UPI000E39FBE6|nr:hypothetical protein [Thermobacillus sp.]REK60136.1 MAG: hypothetical protein C6W55_00115 [Thermobacillus sp.]
MKPHRLYRHSKRVSSETGVVITAPAPPIRRATYQERIDIIRKVLAASPPAERRAMLVELVREELSES